MYDLLLEFIKPELIVLIPVLYMVGFGLKKSAMADKFIPMVLGSLGVLLSGLYLTAVSESLQAESFVMLLFTSLTQGILVAGASVYIDQLIKQSAKQE